MYRIIHFSARHRSKIMASKKLVYPAADRNKEAILSVLRKYIQCEPNRTFLEIASGSGQHIAHFALHFPEILFYPSEYDPRLFESIVAYTNNLANVKYVLRIDITTDYSTWHNSMFEEHSVDYIYNANMIHIAPYNCSIGLFTNAGKLLKQNGILFTYGPYAIDGKITPQSNVNFNKSLKLQDARWGLRDIKDLKQLAEQNNLKLIDIADMPANNKTIIWKKY